MSARLLVLSKFLHCSQARKANFLFLLMLAKKIAVLGILANARKDHSSPLTIIAVYYSLIQSHFDNNLQSAMG